MLINEVIFCRILITLIVLVLVAHAPRNLSRKIPALSTLQHEAKSYLHSNKVFTWSELPLSHDLRMGAT
jgi:hypothetical protein